MIDLKKFFVIALPLASLVLLLPQRAKAQPEVKFSGFVLLNAQYNDGDPANPEIVTAALSGGEKGSFLISPRQSRFTVSISSKDVRWSPAAKFEIDFWGLHTGAGPGGVTQAAPRLRLAYFELQPRSTVKFSFGQNWIVFAPLNPTSFAHVAIPANSGAGNLWARLPMLRVDVKKNKLDLGFSINRPHGGDKTMPGLGQPDGAGAGEHSKVPIFQARVAANLGKSILGVSGHWGKLDFRPNGTGSVNSQAVAGEVKLVLGKVGVMGEYFTAKNVGTLFSSIKASVSGMNVTELKGQGGWGQVSLEASPKISLNAGVGTEDPDDATYNSQVFGNIIYKPDKALAFALEVGYTTTKGVTTREKSLGINLGCQYGF